MELFAGAGGGIIASRILGHKPIIAVEQDEYCCQVLRERVEDGCFPDMQVWEGNIRLFNPSKKMGKISCINAGFPCQPYSVAGSQKGAQDSRDLFTEVYRCIQVVRPEYVFLENVPGLFSSKTGTCLCGWPYRRGGLHSHTQAAEKDYSDIYSGCSDGNDRQSNSDSGHDGSDIWRAFLRNGLQQESQEMGEPMAMAYQWGRSMSVFERDSALCNSEKAAVGTCLKDGRHEKEPSDKQEWDEELERETQNQSSRYERENAPIECDRPRCPECGSRLVSSESESVWYLGAIQQALSSLGYSSEWTTLSAAEVGAKHKRDRWWCLAKRMVDTASKGLPERRRPGRKEGEAETRAGLEPELERPGKDVADTEGKLAGGLSKREAQKDSGLAISSQHAPDTKRQRQQGQRQQVNASDQMQDREWQAGDAFAVRESRKWSAESAMGMLADDVPNIMDGWNDIEAQVGRTTNKTQNRADKLKCLGNAQVPLQAAVAFSYLMEVMKESED